MGEKSVFSCSVPVLSAASLFPPRASTHENLFPPLPHHLFHSSHISYPTQLSPKSPPSLLFPSISTSPSLLYRRLSTLIYPDRSQGSLCLLHLPRGPSPTFPLIPSQRPTVNRVSVIPPYVISKLNPLNLSRLNTKRCPNKSWRKKWRPIAQPAPWLLSRGGGSGGVRKQVGNQTEGFIWKGLFSKICKSCSHLCVNNAACLVIGEYMS